MEHTYRLLGFVCPRYGDIFPQTVAEEIVSMFIIVLGLVFFGIILASLAEALQACFFSLHSPHLARPPLTGISSRVSIHKTVSRKIPDMKGLGSRYPPPLLPPSPSSFMAKQRNCTLARNKRHLGDAPSNQPIVAGVFPQRNVGTLT